MIKQSRNDKRFVDFSPRISFLVSTMGHRRQSILNLLYDLACQTLPEIEIVLVLQLADEKLLQPIKDIIDKFDKKLLIRLVVSMTSGLSLSRNIALAEGKGELLVICDDDCRYPPNTAYIIWMSAANHRDMDILTFQTGAIENEKIIKKYASKFFQHSLRTLMKVSSIEIVLRKKIIQNENNVLFDERIGLGTPYITGGENIMLVDLYKKGYKAGFCPKTIVYHSSETSGCNTAIMESLLFSKAVMFRRMFGQIGIVLAIWFYLRRVLPGKKLRFSIKHVPFLIKGAFIDFK